MHLLKVLLLSLALVVSQTIFANNPTEAELERWFNSDNSNPPEFKHVVNEGILLFLDKQPIKPVHHHANRLTLFKNSLKDGWVKLDQCHTNLDRVERVQITFHKDRVRDIKITKALAIDDSWVENNTVQLKGVNDKAVLCVEAWTKALVKVDEGNYRMSNGPFMRKFLDGYYPLHVTIDVNYQATDLQLVQIEPVAQDGFKVTRTVKAINMDAWFEGRLKTNLTFVN